jgi:hypothetical protein
MLISSLESYQIGMSFSNKTVYLENSTEAQALIARYNITKLPTLLLSASDTELYPIYTQLKKLSDVRDNWLILRDILPPYVDLSANHTVRGLVHVVFLINSSCTACFNATGLSDYISQSSGLAVINRTTYEINSTAGQALLAKYNITKIPTLIYSPEAKHYSNFERIWKNQSSTVESDGWFVFRAHHLLGSVVYQNISR